MADLNNPHDKFFKELTSDNNIARELLELLPVEVKRHFKLDTLKHKKGSYVTGALKELVSDVIFDVELALGNNCYVCILLEHKSYKDKNIQIQLLAYLGNAYLDQIKNDKKLTLILPVVYYHGKEPWELKGIEELFSDYPASLLKYVPRFDIELIDLAQLSEDELIELASDMLITPLLLQKYSSNPDELSNNIVRILGSVNSYLNKSHITAIFVYASQLIELEEKDLKEILKQLPKPAKNSFMTTYEKIIKAGKEIGIQEGKEIGIKAGKEIGIQEGKENTVKKCLKEGLSVDLAARLSGLSIEEVSKIYSND